MRGIVCVLACLPGLLSFPLCASPVPAITIIIDDIGYRHEQDQIALSLPGKLVYAILPNTPGAIQAAHRIHASRREILVHMPMESENANMRQSPGTLTTTMDWLEYIQTIQKNLAAVPYAIGVNNHEGSSLTANRQCMSWLMEELAHHKGLLFVDSRTTHHTVALQAALDHGIAATRRDVFLDFEPGAVASQFRELINLAKKRGTALAIAHPHPETLAFLSVNLPKLRRYGVRLVSLKELLNLGSVNMNEIPSVVSSNFAR